MPRPRRGCPDRGRRRRSAADLAPRDQFGDRLGTGLAEARDDHMVFQILLDARHQPSVPSTSKHELIGGADEQQHHEDPDRSDDQRVEQAGALGHRRDIPIARRRDGDHREVDDVEEADLAVVIVPQPGAVEPVDADGEREQRENRHHPPGDLGPDRGLRRSPERSVEGSRRLTARAASTAGRRARDPGGSRSATAAGRHSRSLPKPRSAGRV